MSTKKIDGRLFARMLRSGMASLQAVEKELNAMNVFPVADGDTGTNMLTTLRNGVRVAPDTANLSEYLKAVSGGMLLGARGNSGVILSQIFKGIYLELSRRAAISAVELRNAFIRGYKVAYEAVIQPEEGTILTVCREGIEQVTRQLKRIPDVETLLSTYLACMEITLARTPEMLPVLAEMGVVDSGGKGYIALIRGMAEALSGEVREVRPPRQAGGAEEPEAAPAAPPVDFSAFHADSVFEEGYCMEFILQLLRSVPYLQNFQERQFIEALGQWGSSMVVVRDETRVKVHIHTLTPAPIISYAQQYGEFLTFKLENMQLQHNEVIGRKEAEALPEGKTARKRVPVATVAAVNGAGMKAVFEDLGCREIIECGPTMNASTEEFLRAIRAANADHTLVLPGNPNLLLAAQQAARMVKRDVRVMEAKTIPESYFALAMDLQDSEDWEARAEQMEQGIRSVETVLIAVAAKSFYHNEIRFPKGKWVAIHHNEPVLAEDDAAAAVVEGIGKVRNIEEKEICVLIRGKGGRPEDGERIQEMLAQRYPLLDCTFLEGGQQIYDWMVGLT